MIGKTQSLNEMAADPDETSKVLTIMWVTLACAGFWLVINSVAGWQLQSPRLLGVALVAGAFGVPSAVAMRQISAGRMSRAVMIYTISGLVALLTMGLLVPELSVICVFTTFTFLAFGLSYMHGQASNAVVALTMVIAATLAITSFGLGWSSGMSPTVARWITLGGLLLALGVDSSIFIMLRQTLDKRSRRLIEAEQKAASDLKAERERAFEAAPIGTLTLDTGLVVARANQAFCDMFGHSCSELTGMPLSELVEFGDWDPAADIRDLLEGRKPKVQGERRGQHRDGTEVWMLMTLSLVRGGQGQAMYFLGHFQDVTERRHLMEMQIQSALRASQLKSKFLASMSHDLRTPLSAIIGFSELLLDGVDGELTPDQKEDIDQIHRSGRTLLQLINDILDLSKIEAGRMTLEIQPVDLNQVVEDVAASLRPLAASKSIWFRTELPAEEVMVMADEMRVRQVITNLFSNALKFTSEGGLTVTVEILSEQARLSVTDTGIGIDEVAQTSVFDEFVQAEGSTTRRYGGTGLGLAITKKLVEMQGGSIGLISSPGQGSTFRFTVPLVLAAKAGPEPDLGNSGLARHGAAVDRQG